VINNRERIFVVTGELTEGSSEFKKVSDLGDDFAEKLPFTKHVVARSPGNAIVQVAQAFDNDIARYFKTESEAGEVMGSVRPLPPDIPRNVSRWKTEELRMPGYRIVLEKT